MAKHNKNQNHPKKFGLLIGCGVVAALLIAVGALLVVRLAHSGQDIKVGDTTITKKTIDNTATDMQQYLKDHPGETFGSGSINDIATKDLVFNKVFKDYAKKCNVSLTNEDVLNAVGVKVKLGQDSSTLLESTLGKEGTFNRIRAENRAYKDKLFDCIVATKGVFDVYITFDAPYFLSFDSVDKVNVAYGAAKKRLNDEFMPMFKAGKSREEIAQHADFNRTDPASIASFDENKFYTQPVIIADYYSYNKDMVFNDMPDAKYIGDPGNLISSNTEVKTLKKIDSYTNVFASQDGTFAILRLESSSKGTYLSWDNFEKDIISKYSLNSTASTKSLISDILASIGDAISYVFKIMSSVIFPSTDVYAVQADGTACKSGYDGKGNLTTNLIYPGIYFASMGGCIGCNHHYYQTPITFRVKGTTTAPNPSSGFSVSVTQPYASICGYPSKYNTSATSAKVTVKFGCWASWSVTYGMASGWTYDSATLDKDTTYYAAAVGGSNNTKTVGDNYVYVTKNSTAWKVTPATTMKVGTLAATGTATNPTSIDPGTKITWTHTGTVTTGTTNKVSNLTVSHASGSSTNPSSAFTPSSTSGSTSVPSKSATSTTAAATYTETYNTKSDGTDGGKMFCSKVTASPSDDKGSSASSTSLCAKVKDIAANYSYTGTSQVATGASIASTNFTTGTIDTRPGWNVAFKHSMTGTGYGKNNANRPNTTYSITKSDGTGTVIYTGAWGGATTADKTANVPTAGAYVGWDWISPYTDGKTKAVLQTDVGTKRCNKLYWTPKDASTPAVQGTADAVCANVPYNYELQPNPATPPDIEPSSKLTPSGDIANIARSRDIGFPKTSQSYKTDSKPSQWQLTTFIVTKGNAIPLADSAYTDFAGIPCSSGAYLKPGVTQCAPNAYGSGRTFSADGSDSGVSGTEITIPDTLNIGDKFCYALSVEPATSEAASGTWRHSKPVCVTVGKRPKVAVQGGGVSATGGIQTNTSSRTINGNGLTFGSYSTAEAISPSTIKGFASGSGYGFMTGINSIDADPFLKVNRLTFANDNNFGNYRNDSYNLSQFDTLYSYFQGVGNSGSNISTSSWAGVAAGGNYKRSGDLTIGGIANIANTTIVYVTGKVTITGNISYDRTSSFRVENVPQLVIVADGDIDIDASVTNIDSWLISKKSVYTCWGSTGNNVMQATDLTDAKCNQQLTINGPVVSTNLNMYRTAGAWGTTAQDNATPAETFKLTPDAYLWAFNQARLGNNKAIVSNVKDLPPRY
ncbi:hypothetical protein FWF48_01815 [Candidatus Saccharibacteria bacterium]|nr:hypothetical protein [Candidatus Saccharibacteria bacterium]